MAGAAAGADPRPRRPAWAGGRWLGRPRRGIHPGAVRRPAGGLCCSGKHSFRPAAAPCAEIPCEPSRTDRRTAQNLWVLADSRPGLPLPRSGRWSAVGQAVRFACACGVRARLGAPPGRGFSASGPGAPRPARDAAKRSARTAKRCKRPPSPGGAVNQVARTSSRNAVPRVWEAARPRCVSPARRGSIPLPRSREAARVARPQIYRTALPQGALPARAGRRAAGRSFACAPRSPGRTSTSLTKRTADFVVPGIASTRAPCLGALRATGTPPGKPLPCSLLCRSGLRRIRRPSWQRAARGRPGVPRSGSGPGRQSRGPRRRAGMPLARGRRPAMSRHATGPFRPARAMS